MLYSVLILFVAIPVLGALPIWPYSANWGYGPSVGLAIIWLVLLALAWT